MDELAVTIAFPDIDRSKANERADGLLSELKQDVELRKHLDLAQTAVDRTDPEAMDFGVTLIAVLGTPAIVILAQTLKSWVERTGTSTLEINGVRIENVRSRDVAEIAKALKTGAQPPAHK